MKVEYWLAAIVAAYFIGYAVGWIRRGMDEIERRHDEWLKSLNAPLI